MPWHQTDHGMISRYIKFHPISQSKSYCGYDGTGEPNICVYLLASKIHVRGDSQKFVDKGSNFLICPSFRLIF